jgi:hypothetical protein
MQTSTRPFLLLTLLVSCLSLVAASCRHPPSGEDLKRDPRRGYLQLHRVNQPGAPARRGLSTVMSRWKAIR